jgi:hypothetical protein
MLYPADLMAVSEASALVNSPKNEGPQLLDPAVTCAIQRELCWSRIGIDGRLPIRPYS